jgi:Uma2 family endonuclease
MPGAELTVEQFLEQRHELPDAGQWTELLRGVPVSLQPPDLEHGTIVYNLSRLMAEYLHRQTEPGGYPCFDLGVVVERSPDTVLFPAMTYFTSGPRFAEADKQATETVPQLVVELLSTQDRRIAMHEKASSYLRLGVPWIWQIDVPQRAVHVVAQNGHARRFGEFETLSQLDPLPGFQTKVFELFREPSWATR